MDKPEFVRDEHLGYLDDLRESGVTNMFGAIRYLQIEYPELNKRESGDVLLYWMRTFSERHGDQMTISTERGMMTKMTELLTRLAQARALEQEYRGKIAVLEAELAQNPIAKQIAALRARASLQHIRDDRAEADVRKAALEAYAEDGNKKPHESVSIRVYTVLDYEPRAALDYARQYIHQALKLNKRVFEKVAKEIDIGFVTKRTEPRVAIARNLSKYEEAQ